MGNKKTSLNTNSNIYTIVYSAIIVVIVAFVLAFVASALKPTQDVNVALDKKKQILAALNIRGISDDKVAEIYTQTVRRDDILDSNGNTKKEGTRGGEAAGFKLNSADFKAGDLALYVCDIDGKTKYVIPVYGMGLWGPISGYISLDDDLNTVYGAYFTHESETAGLGAEIKDNEEWQKQFSGKKIMKPGEETIALQVVKANDVKDKTVQCDGVTGATLTSDGVSNMLRDCLGKYIAFLKQSR